MTRNLLRQIEDSMLAVSNIRDRDGQVILSVPVQYPSGSLAAVEVSGGSENVWVSDQGFGFFEAEMLGADDRYPQTAKIEAQMRGVKFDGRSVFAIKVPISQVAAAIIAVANASVASAVEAVRAERDHVISEQNQFIFEKVKSAFPSADVIKLMDVSGARSPWRVHNVVRIADKIAIFEPVVMHPTSISAKYLMFSDLAAKHVGKLNAVVSDPSSMKPKGQMLRDVASVIGVDADISAYQRAFEAA